MTRFVKNPAAVAAVEHDPDFVKQMASVARALVGAVKAADPTGPGGFERTVRPGISPDGHPAVWTTDPFAHLIEFGSVNNPPYAPFRVGVRTAGLRFTDVNR